MKSSTKIRIFLFFIFLVSISCAGSSNVDAFVNQAGAVVEGAVKAAIEEAIAEYGFDIPTDKIQEIEFSGGALNMVVEGKYDTFVLLMKTNALAGGLSERGTSTEISDDSVTMTFDGHDSGLATIITIIDEGDGLVRVRISLQDS